MRSIAGRDPRTGRSIEVGIEDGRIASIQQASGDETAWLSPGLIDLQINGYAGFDLNAEGLTPETVIALAHRLLSTGVTTFLPTLITASERQIVAALQAIAEARRRDPVVSHMAPGVHLEGPHISSEDGAHGAHPRQHIRPPSLEEFNRWQRISGGLVRLVTLSPHFDEVPAYIAALRTQGVHVSLGHTHCTAEQIHAAAAAGARLCTHLGNGVAELLPRHPNMIWAQLADERLTAMFIADGHHLPVDTLIAMIRAKGIDRSILVSDTVALGGMSPGLYHTTIGGEVELSAAGRLSLAGSRYLAGAAHPLKDDLAYLTHMCGMPLADALRLATENPGRFAGDRGLLKVGADADLIRYTLNKNGAWTIHTTLVQGRECLIEPPMSWEE